MSIVQKAKKGFTLVELIVVMVIIAILGGVGFNAFSNYISETNLTKVSDEFSVLQRGVFRKFSQSFTEGSVVRSLDSSNGTPNAIDGDLGNLSGAQAHFSNMTSAQIDTIPTTIKINGENHKIIDTGTINPFMVVNTSQMKQSSTNSIIAIWEDQPGGNKYAIVFKKLNDSALCESSAVDQKPIGQSLLYIQNRSSTTGPGCIITSRPEMLILNPTM